MLLDLHTDFSGGREGSLVLPSLEELFIVCCDPHSQRFGIVNKAEVDICLEFSCFLYDPMDVGNLISGSSGSGPFLKEGWCNDKTWRMDCCLRSMCAHIICIL